MEEINNSIRNIDALLKAFYISIYVWTVLTLTFAYAVFREYIITEKISKNTVMVLLISVGLEVIYNFGAAGLRRQRKNLERRQL